MVAIKQWYDRVNATWPAELPPMTFKQGCNAVSRLLRFTEGNAWTGGFMETSGNRYNWTKGGKFCVNPGGNGHGHDRMPNGWKDLIHDMSHWLVRRGKLWDYRVKPHSRDHAMLELKLVREVVRRGWLTAEPVPVRVPQLDLPETIEAKPDPADAKAARIALKVKRIEASLKRWTTKQRRAATAIRKLTRQQRYYERRS